MRKHKFGGFVPPDAPVTGAKKKAVAEVDPVPAEEPETEAVQPEPTQKPKGGKD